MLGDFNANNTLWGPATVDARGREVEHFINNRNINIMNNGAPTRISYDTDIAIDLIMRSSNLKAYLQEAQQGNNPT